MGVHQFDLVWIEKEALPWFPAWFEKWLLRRVPYVLDFDDAIFHDYDLHRPAWVRRVYGRRIDRLMAGARMIEKKGVILTCSLNLRLYWIRNAGWHLSIT